MLRNIIGTNLLTKIHEDLTINVASRVFTRQMLMPDKRRSVKPKISTLCSGELEKQHVSLIQPHFINANNKLTSRVLTRQILTPHDAQQTKGHPSSNISKTYF
ncbi:hypothetical protein DPMN_077919 [Dreissena polymorpha]|uniref:Uncharacterized protein n=1 Tax=Dreissena polymorpha TaxID=45954 RepID=A0A9D3YLB9_DREPO|nr:hypothetical protein DPMN_077919 [Dreissena polymorpha]